MFLGVSLKEVIQGHLPVALPCYDFITIINQMVGPLLPRKRGLE
jgi:hypothetical protein